MRKSLQYELLERLNLQKFQNNHTKTAYKKDIKAFSDFAKNHGYKSMKALENGLEALQSYSDYLQECGYTAATIHRKLCSPCLALGVSMKEIQKPKRTSGKIVRGRKPEANRQGKEEEQQEKYKRLVSFQNGSGIRRNELAHLEGRDIRRDSFGYLTVIVRRGKGGKKQFQRILPDKENIVLQTFHEVSESQRVFSPEEMENHINLHGIRASVAREAYAYYERLVSDPAGREKLLEELRSYYMELHPYDPKKQKKEKAYYCMEWLNKTAGNAPYKLRGENKEKAIAAVRPTEYNRLALLAVSVFHLSHWRLDVTVTNYLVQ